MVWLTSAEVKGLAGRAETIRVEFNRGTNIFWGLNGSGKTSFLRILDSAVSGDANTIQGLLFESAEVKFYSVSRGHEVARTIDRTQLRLPSATTRKSSRAAEISSRELESSSVDSLTEFLRLELPEAQNLTPAEIRNALEGRGGEWVTKPKDPPGTKRYAHRYLPTSRLVNTSRVAADGTRQPFRRDDYESAFASNITQLWRRYYTNELGRIREIQQRGLATVLNSVVNGRARPVADSDAPVDADEAFRAVTSFFRAQGVPIEMTKRAFRQTFEKDDLLSSIVAEVVAVEANIEAAQEPSRRLIALIEEMFSGAKKVEIDDEGLSVSGPRGPIPLQALSSGEKQLMLVLLETMRAESNFIMIDEPEISMHVDWQNRLIDCMRTVNPDAQVIVATHSPEVMVGRSPNEIFEL